MPRRKKVEPKRPTIGDIAYVIPIYPRVPDPFAKAPLPAQGRRHRINQHWLRCEKRGEVELCFTAATLSKGDTPEPAPEPAPEMAPEPEES